MSTIKDRRIGRFKISLEIINEHPDVVRKVMGACIILQADNNFATDEVTYVALCEDFLPMEDGEEIRYYDLEYDADEEAVNWSLPEEG